MSFEFIELRREQGFAVLTLNRPEVLNAINNKMRQEIAAAVNELTRDEQTKSVILTGKGRAFCAGADIKELSAKDPIESRKQVKLGGNEPYNSVANCIKPTIAAINGYALGGGLELALACDIRIASKDAKLGLPELSRGLIPGAGGTQRLHRLIGTAMAKEMIFTGNMIDAQEAERIGLANHICAHEELMKSAEEMALKIAKNAPFAMMLAKSAIDNCAHLDINAALKYEAELNTILFYTEDRKEGAAAFLAKRAPAFTGR